MRIYLNLVLFVVFCTSTVFAGQKDFVQFLLNKKKSTSVEFIAHHNEDLAIEKAKNLIRKHQGTAIEPQVRHRLADLYLKKVMTKYFVDFNKKNKTLDNGVNFTNLKSISNYLSQIIVNTEAIKNKYPKYSKREDVLYLLANAYSGKNNEKKAIENFKLYLSEFRNTPRKSEINNALGEIYYGRKNHKEAYKYYTVAQSDKNFAERAYSIYKRAWTQYFMGNSKSALADMKSAVNASAASSSKFDVYEDVLSDLPIFFVEAKKGQEANAFYSSIAKNKDDLESVLLEQSVAFRDKSDFNSESAILDVLLKDYRSSSRLWEYSLHRAVALENQDRFIESSKLYNIAYKSINKKDSEAKQKISSQARTHLETWYNLWLKKTKSTATIAPAVANLAEGLILFGNSDNIKQSKIHNIAAETYREVKNYSKASHHYEQAAALTTDNKAEDLWISSVATQVESVTNDKWSVEQRNRLNSLTRTYGTKYPRGSQYLNMFYKVARVDVQLGQLDPAQAVFISLGKKFPNTKKGIESQDGALKIFEDKKDYVSANRYLGELVLLNREHRRLRGLKLAYEDSFFKAAEQFESKKKYKKANEYLSGFIAKGFDPNKKIKASWNMAVNYKKDNSWKLAADQYVKYYKQNPKNEKSLGGLNHALEIYKKKKKYNDVATVAQLLEGADPVNKQAWKWVKTDNYIKAKNYKMAQANVSALLKSNNEKVNEQMHQRLFDFVEKPKHKFYLYSLATLKREAKEPFKAEAWYKEAEYAYRSKKHSKMAQNIRTIRKSRSASSEVKGRATHLGTKIAKFELKKTRDILSPTQAKSLVEKAVRSGTKFIGKHQEVLDYNDSESSVKSLYEINKAYIEIFDYMNSLKIEGSPNSVSSTKKELIQVAEVLRGSFLEATELAKDHMGSNKKVSKAYKRKFKTLETRMKIQVRKIREKV